MNPGAKTFPGAKLFPGRRRPPRFFTTPVVVRDFVIEGALRGSLQYGIQVMRIDGHWVETEFPTWEQEQAADLIFRGGTTTRIDADMASALTAAGYTVTTEF